jgi:hypothetical protein
MRSRSPRREQLPTRCSGDRLGPLGRAVIVTARRLQRSRRPPIASLLRTAGGRGD